MTLLFNNNFIANYHSGTQIARVLTENWVAENMFCPRCGYFQIRHFENNRPVADFFVLHVNMSICLFSENSKT